MVVGGGQRVEFGRYRTKSGGGAAVARFDVSCPALYPGDEAATLRLWPSERRRPDRCRPGDQDPGPSCIRARRPVDFPGEEALASRHLWNRPPSTAFPRGPCLYIARLPTCTRRAVSYKLCGMYKHGQKREICSGATSAVRAGLCGPGVRINEPLAPSKEVKRAGQLAAPRQRQSSKKPGSGALVDARSQPPYVRVH